MRTHSLSIRSACVLMFAAAAAPTVVQAFSLEDFDYTFESLELGNINGQDGWIVTNGIARVLAGPGVNASKTVTRDDFGNSEMVRSLPESLHYTAADTAVVWSFQGYVGFTPGGANSMIALTGANSENFGLEKTGDVLSTRMSAGPIYGDILEIAHWYEMRVTVDFSVVGGLATLTYRDLTLGEQSFTVDETLRNINLGAFADGLGRYTFPTVLTRQDSANGVCFVDNIHIDAPAPPCPADIEPDAGNGMVNIDDYTEVILNWGTKGPQGDVDGDGAVNINDYTAIVLGWGDC